MAEPDLVPSSERTGQVPCRDRIVPCSQGGQWKGRGPNEYIVSAARKELLDCQDHIVRTDLIRSQDRTDLVTCPDRVGSTEGRYRQECTNCGDSVENTDCKEVRVEEEVIDNQCSLTSESDLSYGILDMLHTEELGQLKGSEEYACRGVFEVISRKFRGCF